MNLEEVIYKRQSHRDYYQNTADNETLEAIHEFILTAKPLYPHIKTTSLIVGNENVTNLGMWKAPHYIAIYSEKKEGYLTNVGFIYQQVDLFLQSIGLGSVWLGMGKYRPDKKDIPDDEEFVILIAFGKVKSELFRPLEDFKRKSLNEISDSFNSQLEVARLAPSSVNSQPWYFLKEDGYYNIYCEKLNFIKRKILGKLNKIDIGIALAHLYVANRKSFEFFKIDNPTKLNDYYYVGSFKI